MHFPSTKKLFPEHLSIIRRRLTNEEYSIFETISTSLGWFYGTIDDLHWKTDSQAASLI